MRLTDQVRALEEENTRLRAALAAEQDKRRKWQGALNRAEDTIRKHMDNAMSQWDREHALGDKVGMTIYTQKCLGLRYGISAIDKARKETSQ